MAQQQLVAIARALDTEARLLILDEPTASLDEREVAELFKVMRRLRTDGLGIVFVTHFLEQVYAVCDRLTILRNGESVGEHPVAGLSRLELVSKMLGREWQNENNRSSVAAAEARSQIPIFAAKGIGRQGTLHPVDVALFPGEVLGLGGLLGAGRTETARLIFGVDRADAGKFFLRGKEIAIRSPRQAVRHRLALCSEDRKREGLLPNLSVRENLIVALQGKRGLWRTLSDDDQRKLCDHYIAALRIKTADLELPIKHLSGGNQQKVLLARWLATQPEVMLLDEPTRGIDIGAKAEVEQLIETLRAKGLAVLFISSEIEEVVRNCSRVLVLRERRVAAELVGNQVELNLLMKSMAGDA